MKNFFVSIVLLCIAGSSFASEQDVLMVRSTMPFPEAMSSLQNSIIEHKYTLSRVQRIDVGLEKAGFKTSRYRIVFFGKHDEMKLLTDSAPQIAAFLPLKLVIFSEGDETMIVALNPLHYDSATNKPEHTLLLKRWHNDIKSIMEDVRKEE